MWYYEVRISSHQPGDSSEGTILVESDGPVLRFYRDRDASMYEGTYSMLYVSV